MINSELENLKEQLHDNKLSLNIEKTISIIVGTKSMQTNENAEKPFPNVTIDGDLANNKVN